MTELLNSQRETLRQQWQEYLKRSGPTTAVVLELTYKCDHGLCAHCYCNAEKYVPYLMQPEDFISIEFVDNWANILAERIPPAQIWIAGGEPTLHPQLLRINELLIEKGFQTVLITNGERLADQNVTQSLLSTNGFTEVAITLRGEGGVHDLFMKPLHSRYFEDDTIQQNITAADLIVNLATLFPNSPHFHNSIAGLVNIANLAPQTRIALNIDMHYPVDLERILARVKSAGGRIDQLYLQVQLPAGRALNHLNDFPNIWRQPTISIVEEYIKQCTRSGIPAEIIDHLPDSIINALGDQLQGIYNPQATPAISPQGQLRSDVIYFEK